LLARFVSQIEAGARQPPMHTVASRSSPIPRPAAASPKTKPPSCSPSSERRRSRSPHSAPRPASTGALSAPWPTAARGHPSGRACPTPPSPTRAPPAHPSRRRVQRARRQHRPAAHAHTGDQPEPPTPRRSTVEDPPPHAPVAAVRGAAPRSPHQRSRARRPVTPNDALAAHLDRPSTRALTPRASTALPPGVLRRSASSPVSSVRPIRAARPVLRSAHPDRRPGGPAPQAPTATRR
jgi:hypothetical protein